MFIASFNPLLSGSVFLTSGLKPVKTDIESVRFNPLLSGSVFLTFGLWGLGYLIHKICGFNPLLSGSVFLTKIRKIQ